MPVAGRRCHTRFSATYSVLVRDLDGRIVARGRTANVSVTGIFVIAPIEEVPGLNEELLVEVALPRSPEPGDNRRPRKAHYLARVIRIRQIRQLVGLGMELLEKLTPADASRRAEHWASAQATSRVSRRARH